MEARLKIGHVLNGKRSVKFIIFDLICSKVTGVKALVKLNVIWNE